MVPHVRSDRGSTRWKVKRWVGGVMSLSIGEAAAACGLPKKTVRYYADIGLVTPAARSSNGYRVYSPAEISQLIFVRRARAFGFSVDECRELLGLYCDEGRASADVKRVAERRLEELRAKMRELEALQTELAELVDACRGDGGPDCPIIEALSEPP